MSQPRTFERIPSRYAAAQFGTQLTEELRVIIGENKATVEGGVLTVKAKDSYPSTLRLIAGEWLVRVTRESDDDNEDGRLFSLNDANFKAKYRAVSDA